MKTSYIKKFEIKSQRYDHVK